MFHKFFLIFDGGVVMNLDNFPSEMLRGICNLNSIHSFIFKLCIMIVYTLKMCTSYFVRLFHFFLIFDGC